MWRNAYRAEYASNVYTMVSNATVDPRTTAEALLSGAARLLSRRDVRAGAGVICALGIATLILTEATRRR